MTLINLLPELYAASPETADLQNAFGQEIAAAQAARDDLMLQLNMDTATWGLSLWEAIYGIKPDVSKSYDYRRTRIISKMRGAGTTTAALIQNVAESFSNGDVEIIEIPAQHRFDVKFVGTLGIPPNMDDLTAVIEQIKPAHLAYAYIFIYMIWGVLDAQAITFTQLDALNVDWDTFKRGEWIG